MRSTSRRARVGMSWMGVQRARRARRVTKVWRRSGHLLLGAWARLWGLLLLLWVHPFYSYSYYYLLNEKLTRNQRKLPWTSTLQVSLTLALVNPFLWYLLDRSKPGFFLSTLIAVTFTPGLLALDSSLVPNPLDAGTKAAGNGTVAGAGAMGGLGKAYRDGRVDSAIWIMSVLFCSVLCFGHIGRRLALLRRRARAKQV